MSSFAIIAILIILCAVFSFLNERYIKLPGMIGVVVLSLVVSLFILIGGKAANTITESIKSLAQNIDFSDMILNVMLGFLLFASAIQFNYKELRALRRPVLFLSTMGVVISAFAFAGMFYGMSLMLQFKIPFIYCLVFGALISPTDPVVVNAMLKRSKVPSGLRTIISGETLFNDGVGIILFITFLEMTHPIDETLAFKKIAVLFFHEVIGGIVIGTVLGYLGSRLMKTISTDKTKFLLSIALVLAISLLAHQYHASIPLAAATAGLITGNSIFNEKHAQNQFLIDVWELFDEVLNILFFVMIGLQLVLMPFVKNYWLIGGFSILIILIARLVSILLPAVTLLQKVNIGRLSILTWAGLRGGVSVALALSLPASPYRRIILSACYLVVLFSVIVQGLTLNRVVNGITKRLSVPDRKSL